MQQALVLKVSPCLDRKRIHVRPKGHLGTAIRTDGGFYSSLGDGVLKRNAQLLQLVPAKRGMSIKVKPSSHWELIQFPLRS